MAKVKIINNSLQVLNILLKEGKDNKNIQLVSKEEIVVDKQTLTDQIKRLNDLGHLRIVPYTESVIL
jgi:hypothetical protein